MAKIGVMNDKQPSLQDQRDALTRKMDQWRQEHPQATLTEIEEAVEAELGQVRKQLVERMAVAAAETEHAVPVCPQCGQNMVKNGRRRRKLKGKEGETIQLDRQQWRCLDCGATLFPPG
jgi:uncharacterized protein with PIN domain